MHSNFYRKSDYTLGLTSIVMLHAIAVAKKDKPLTLSQSWGIFKEVLLGNGG